MSAAKSKPSVGKAAPAKPGRSKTPAAKSKTPAVAPRAGKAEKSQTPSPKLRGVALASREEIRDAVAGVIEMGGGPWTYSDLVAQTAEALRNPFPDDDSLLSEVTAAMDRGDLEYASERYRIPAAKIAASALGVAICRVLGEAHEPLSLADVSKALDRAGEHPSSARLRATIEALAPEYVESTPGGYVTAGRRFVEVEIEATSERPKPPAPPIPLNPRNPIDSEEPIVAPALDARPVDPPREEHDVPAMLVAQTLAKLSALLDEAIAKPGRSKMRITVDLDEAAVARVTEQRDGYVRTLDAYRAAILAAQRRIRLCNKRITKRKATDNVLTVSVPDYDGSRLVTYDVTRPEDPRVVRVKKLPLSWRQLDLPAASDGGRASP